VPASTVRKPLLENKVVNGPAKMHCYLSEQDVACMEDFLAATYGPPHSGTLNHARTG